MPRVPEGPYDQYEHGTANAICDVCGFKRKLHQLQRRWDGLLVCEEDWEPRQPLDYPPEIRPNHVLQETRPDEDNPTAVSVRVGPDGEFVETTPTDPDAVFDIDDTFPEY